MLWFVYISSTFTFNIMVLFICLHFIAVHFVLPSNNDVLLQLSHSFLHCRYSYVPCTAPHIWCDFVMMLLRTDWPADDVLPNWMCCGCENDLFCAVGLFVIFLFTCHHISTLLRLLQRIWSSRWWRTFDCEVFGVVINMTLIYICTSFILPPSPFGCDNCCVRMSCVVWRESVN